jgi:hypothetical protein
MKFYSKVALGALAFVLIASGIGIINPSTVRAVVATIIRDQDNPARHPFTAVCSNSTSGANNVSCSTPIVPAGQEVVIEGVAIEMFANPGFNNKADPSVSATSAGNLVTYVMNAVLDDGGSTLSNHFQMFQTLRLYADPGQPISCSVRVPTAVTQMFIGCAFSGYYVTLP